MIDILIVDDDVELGRALCTRLRREGFRAHAVAGGREAIESFDELRPRVVLLDASMPDVSGFDVCEHIRRTGSADPAHVIFVSGATTPTPDYAARCSQLTGGDAFLRKPYDSHVLVEMVRAALIGSTQGASS